MIISRKKKHIALLNTKLFFFVCFLSILWCHFRILFSHTNEALGNMSHGTRKPTMSICENKDADRLSSNCTADQHLCFRYTDSTIPLLLKSEISSFSPASVIVQAGFVRPGSEQKLFVFSCEGSFMFTTSELLLPCFQA